MSAPRKPEIGPPDEQKQPVQLYRRLLAELTGTFALTFVAAGADTISVVSGGQVDHVSRAVAPALMVLAMIFAFGNVSGAHINPVVTLAFAVRRVFHWTLVPLYVIVQLAGAVLAAVLLWMLFGDASRSGMTEPNASNFVVLVMEGILTFFLVSVIVATANRHGELGSNSALPVGATIALCGLFASPISGASMNPARSFGPALLGGDLPTWWLYVVGPLLGAAVATLVVTLVQGPAHVDEAKAASGDGG